MKIIDPDEEISVKISKSRYKALLKAEIKLDMLEAGGVDNWEWYGESLNPDGGKSYSDLCEELDEEK